MRFMTGTLINKIIFGAVLEKREKSSATSIIPAQSGLIGQAWNCEKVNIITTRHIKSQCFPRTSFKKVNTFRLSTVTVVAVLYCLVISFTKQTFVRRKKKPFFHAFQAVFFGISRRFLHLNFFDICHYQATSISELPVHFDETQWIFDENLWIYFMEICSGGRNEKGMAKAGTKTRPQGRLTKYRNSIKSFFY